MRARSAIVSLPVIASFVVLFSLGTGAQEAGQGRREGNVCREDMERLCADVKPGGGARVRCLKDHEDALSDACRAQIAERSPQGHDRGGKVVHACGDDAKRLCTGLEPGGGGILRCLRKHEADLSSSCRDALRRPRQE